MPRKARKYINTQFFHVMCQGIKKENIFENSMFMEKYIEYIKKYKAEFLVDVIAYCVMPNHVHLLLRACDIDYLSKFMHKVNSVYAMMYNKQKERVGYVFRDRFKMEGISDKRYLSSCIVYIHNNPVKAGICKEVSKYKYSSYKEYVKKPHIVNNEIVKQITGIEIYEEMERQSFEEGYIFVDEKVPKELLAKEIIKTFEEEKSKNIYQILNDNKYRRELLVKLHIENNISYRCLSRVLPLERRMIKAFVDVQEGQA